MQEEQRHLLPSQAELQSEALAEVAAARAPRGDRVPMRRKKAQGPNPLAARPKQKKAAAGRPQQQPQQQGEGGDAPAKKKRQRRRGKGAAGGGGGDGGSD